MNKIIISIMLIFILSMIAFKIQAETSVEHLEAMPKPNFKEDHNLPPLTRFGWSIPYDLNVELAKYWGYAVDFPGKYLNNPESIEAKKLLKLVEEDPQTYQLAVVEWPPGMHNLKVRDHWPEETWTRDEDGNLVNGKHRFSPEAPAFVFKEVVDEWIDKINKIKERVPITMIVNGGEYGLGVIGFDKENWEKDPEILKAKGERSWFEYISESKARQELIISKAIREAFPGRKLYLYYTTTNSNKDRYKGWKDWGWGYRWMAPVSDLPVGESYYQHYNSGWTGNQDMVTHMLNAVGQIKALGNRYFYEFLSAGWKGHGHAEIDRYTGFLKLLYTAGMVGGNAGYYALPESKYRPDYDYGDEPPHYLKQKIALAHVHALFSHLEKYLWEGYLLPGPKNHKWSQDQPAYEFPVDESGVRILARKLRNEANWLITSWSAKKDVKEVTVEIPGLGEVVLEARKEGSVYQAIMDDGEVNLNLVDKNGIYPTVEFSFNNSKDLKGEK